MSRLWRKSLKISSRRLALRPRVNLMSSARKPGWSILNKLVRKLRLDEANRRHEDETEER